MSADKPNTCAKCRHSARGTAIDMRSEEEVRRRPFRASLEGGGYICGRQGLTPGETNPVTGFTPLPSGPDCRDLNPDGRCPYYRRGLLFSDVFAALLVLGGLTVFGLLAARLLGWVP